MSLASYSRAQTLAEHPRTTEYRLIAQVTAQVQAQWAHGLRGAALVPVLHRNREMWSAFAADCAAAGNGLPDGLRAAIISLSLWVDRFTSGVVRGEEDIEPLLEVNRSIMEGLAAAGSATLPKLHSVASRE
ncbi:flagellar biosynthesis regulatory protein FlaF [Sphingomonas ginkgonis]|uniref:Flagellar biosynthesis regulatory protein FlaF n=1 Tax=Sphingomonas ginkgonis TaxID=2315330 RepID=A0A3R9WSV9_9SPHN|nr:flagellar biosynthesis regulator FlaF [Sphingomonas ginkgonis]RST30976.1 flagellar biosynthesis regulatory protein FlaF [Sphingomonas ginkgonis]